MRIAITADPTISVPPHLYGGIERIIHMLVLGLVGRKHDVTLFAHPESVGPCRLEGYAQPTAGSRFDHLRNAYLVSSTILRERFDVVHSFGRLAYMLPVLALPVPKIMSYQRAVTARSVSLGNRLSRGTIHFTGCSHHLIGRFAGQNNWHVIYNGVPADIYDYREMVASDAPLVFLGRIEEIKGPHLAIEVARRSQRRLVIAGNVPTGPEHATFFDAQIAPHLDDDLVRYVGPVDDLQKNALLGGAAALLMPILWDEPFGIVMAEALACGTPVIGLNRGSVPEVVHGGLNGFVCDSVDDMVEAVARITDVERRACRLTMEQRFSDRAVVQAYEDLYVMASGTSKWQ